MRDTFTRYLDHLRHERHLAAHTLNSYRRDLQDFTAFLDDRQATPDDADAALIRKYLADLNRRGRRPATLRRRLVTLRGWLDYRLLQGEITANPACWVELRAKGQRLPTVWTADRLQALLQPEPEDDLECRDHAMLELLYGSGIRLQELVDSDIADLDLADGSLRVRGKGDKRRVVPVGSRCSASLERWLTRRQAMVDEKALFVGRRGRRLQPRSVELRIKRWAVKHGMEGLYPHLLRHCCASHTLESSGDLRAVQELLGHAHLSTTQIYTHLDFQHLAQVYDRAHPRARRR